MLKVNLRDFGCFAKRKSPVIFLKLAENNSLQVLHSDLMHLLRETGFPESETDLDFHPHMTVANRDLSRHKFKEAWADFKGRSFHAEFNVTAIHLLKHDGKFWIQNAEFPLKK